MVQEVTTTAKWPLTNSWITTVTFPCLCPQTTTLWPWWSQLGRCPRRRTQRWPSRQFHTCWERWNKESCSWLATTPTFCARSSMTSTLTSLAPWLLMRWLTWLPSCRLVLSASMCTPSSKWWTKTTLVALSTLSLRLTFWAKVNSEHKVRNDVFK